MVYLCSWDPLAVTRSPSYHPPSTICTRKEELSKSVSHNTFTDINLKSGTKSKRDFGAGRMSSFCPFGDETSFPGIWEFPGRLTKRWSSSFAWYMRFFSTIKIHLQIFSNGCGGFSYILWARDRDVLERLIHLNSVSNDVLSCLAETNFVHFNGYSIPQSLEIATTFLHNCPSLLHKVAWET